MAEGLLAESSGSDGPWDRGQGMDTAPCPSWTFIGKSSSILSIAPSASSLHPLLHKAVFAYVPPVVTA